MCEPPNSFNSIIVQFDELSKVYSSSNLETLISDYIASLDSANEISEIVEFLKSVTVPEEKHEIDPDFKLKLFKPLSLLDQYTTSEYYDKINNILCSRFIQFTEFIDSVVFLTKIINNIGQCNLAIMGLSTALKQKYHFISNNLLRNIADIAVKPPVVTIAFDGAKNLSAVIVGLTKIANSTTSALKQRDTAAAIDKFLNDENTIDPDPGIACIQGVLAAANPQFEANKLLEILKFPKETQIQSQAAVMAVILYSIKSSVNKTTPLKSRPNILNYSPVETLKKLLETKNPNIILNVVAEATTRADVAEIAKNQTNISILPTNFDDNFDYKTQLENLKKMTGLGVKNEFDFFEDQNFIDKYESKFTGTKLGGPTINMFGGLPKRRPPNKTVTVEERTLWPSRANLIENCNWRNKFFNTLGEILLQVAPQTLTTPMINTTSVSVDLDINSFYTQITNTKILSKVVATCLPSLIDLSQTITNDIAPQIYKSLFHIYVERVLKDNEEMVRSYIVEKNKTLEEVIFDKHSIWPYAYSYRTCAFIYQKIISSRVYKMPIHIIGNYPPYQLLTLLVFHFLGYKAQSKNADINSELIKADEIGRYIMINIASGIGLLSNTNEANQDYASVSTMDGIVNFVYNRILDLILENAESSLFSTISGVNNAGSAESAYSLNYVEYMKSSTTIFGIACQFENTFSKLSSFKSYDPNATGVATSHQLHIFQTEFLTEKKAQADCVGRLSSSAYACVFYSNQFKLLYEFFIKKSFPKILFQSILEDTDSVNFMNQSEVNTFLERVKKTQDVKNSTNTNVFGSGPPKCLTEKEKDYFNLLMRFSKKEEAAIFSLFLTRQNNFIKYDKKIHTFNKIDYVILKFNKSEIDSRIIQHINDFNFDHSEFTPEELSRYSKYIFETNNSTFHKININYPYNTEKKDDEIYLSIPIIVMTIIYHLSNTQIASHIYQKCKSLGKLFCLIQNEIKKRLNSEINKNHLSIEGTIGLLYDYFSSNCIPKITDPQIINIKYLYKPKHVFITQLLDCCYDFYLNKTLYDECINQDKCVYYLTQEFLFKCRYINGPIKTIIGGKKYTESFWETCKKYYMIEQQCLFKSLCITSTITTTIVNQKSFFETMRIIGTDGLDPGYVFYKCKSTKHTSCCEFLHSKMNIICEKDDYNDNNFEITNFHVENNCSNPVILMVPIWMIYLVNNFNTHMFYTKTSQTLFIKLCSLFSNLQNFQIQTKPYKKCIESRNLLVSNLVSMVVNATDDCLNLVPNVPFVKIQTSIISTLINGLFIKHDEFNIFGGSRKFKRKVNLKDTELYIEDPNSHPKLMKSNPGFSLNSIDNININNTTILDDLNSKTEADVVDLKNLKVNWNNWSQLKTPKYQKTNVGAIDIPRTITSMYGVDPNLSDSFDSALRGLEKLTIIDPKLKNIRQDFKSISDNITSKTISYDFTISKLIVFFKFLMDRLQTQLNLFEQYITQNNLYLNRLMNPILLDLEYMFLENFFVQEFIKNPQLFLHVPDSLDKTGFEDTSAPGTFKCKPSMPEFEEVFNSIGGNLTKSTWQERLDFIKSLKKNNITFVDLDSAKFKEIQEFLVKNKSCAHADKVFDLFTEFEVTPIILKDYRIIDPIKWSKKKPVFFLGILIYGLVLDACGVKFDY